MCTHTQEMTVASWQKIGAIDLISKNVPVLKPGEVLVKVAASGICGKTSLKC
jgi:threonine dehydrogenase-like Zn-dependent dehydrogenase